MARANQPVDTNIEGFVLQLNGCCDPQYQVLNEYREFHLPPGDPGRIAGRYEYRAFHLSGLHRHLSQKTRASDEQEFHLPPAGAG
jgi:hypothetical protein